MTTADVLAVIAIVASIGVHLASVRRDNRLRDDAEASEKRRRTHDDREGRIDRVVERYRFKTSIAGENAGESLSTVLDSGVQELRDDAEVRDMLERIRMRCRTDPMCGAIEQYADVNLHVVFQFLHANRLPIGKGTDAVRNVLRRLDAAGVDYHRR